MLLDAANTIIYKPDLFKKFNYALELNGISVDEKLFVQRHKLLSEIVEFPDQTSKEFYERFNSELLISMGIIPNKKILKDIFDKCTYLPWNPYPDTEALKHIPLPKVILSNFNSSLRGKLTNLFGDDFFHSVIASEEEGIRKPHLAFYERAITKLKVKPSEILFIGDSIKLDIVPAKSSGMATLLMDRDGNFPLFQEKIRSFDDLLKHME